MLGPDTMLLLIDNYDSFTYNLVHYLGELGADVQVWRNDAFSLQDVKRLKPSHIIVSPGPGRPEDAGITPDVIRAFAPGVPILGVCLGHQAMAQCFGGTVVRARRLMHGKTSEIHHDGRGLYRGLENPFTATRYHSLIVRRETLPDCLVETAKTKEGELMGIRHKEYEVEGVQFHPESFLTEVGLQLIRNFLEGEG